jgi:hypothetical protein
MSQPTPEEDRRLNRAMGRAAAANDHMDHAYADTDLLVGGLPNFKEILAERERTIREKALTRAKESGLQAYPVKGFGEGWFAVPSQTDLGQVYLVHLNTYNGEPNTCTCPNPQKWCTHSGAARAFYDAARDADDARRAADAAANIIDLQTQRSERNG